MSQFDELYEKLEEAARPLSEWVKDPSTSQEAIETIGDIVTMLASYLDRMDPTNQEGIAAANRVQLAMQRASSREEAISVLQTALRSVAGKTALLRKWTE